MIPKKIHYCWFGGKPLPEEAVKCIKSWKKFCPDYEIKEWNEKNFDINSNKYVKEAYQNKKWAFITDYVRLYAMVKEGGIYMDTDVEVIKPLDKFLDCKAFTGFESSNFVPTGIMACEKNFLLFKELLKDYDKRSFVLKNGELDLTTNVETITKICLKKGLILNNKYQEVSNCCFYPSEFFCPKDCYTYKINITDNTVVIHHFSGSWLPIEDKKIYNFRRKILQKSDNKFNRFICYIYEVNIRFFTRIKNVGIKSSLKYYFEKYFTKKRGKNEKN